MQNSWQGILASQQGAGTAVTNTTTQTTILGAGAKPLLPSTQFTYPGQAATMSAGGIISTAASAPGTLTFTVMYGAVAILAFAASPTLATSQSNVPWSICIEMAVKTIAAGVASAFSADMTFNSVALSATTPIQVGQITTGTSFDNTLSVAMDLQVTWSVASASNSIQSTRYRLVSLN